MLINKAEWSLWEGRVPKKEGKKEKRGERRRKKGTDIEKRNKSIKVKLKSRIHLCFRTGRKLHLRP